MNEVIQIRAPHFTGAALLYKGKVHSAAPILKYMRGWDAKQVLAYARKKGWEVLRDKPGEEVLAFTDGSCWPNPKGQGGWAVVARWRDKAVEYYGCARKVSNNAMELLAILRALECITPTRFRLTVVTDSQYAWNAITEWYSKWKANGWITSTGAPAANRELLDAIEQAKQRHPLLRFLWVKGHDEHPDNERADKLASKARKEQITNWD